MMAVAAALLAIRFVAGPFHSAVVTVNSPVNAAAAVAVSFVLLVLIGTWNCAGPLPEPRTAWVDLSVIIAATAVAFWPNLRSPLVYDDYRHIVEASHATWRILADAFAPVPGGHGLFFRPVGFISYWLDYQWAGADAIRWHLWSLVAHAANTCLVYVLVTRHGDGRRKTVRGDRRLDRTVAVAGSAGSDGHCRRYHGHLLGGCRRVSGGPIQEHGGIGFRSEGPRTWSAS